MHRQAIFSTSLHPEFTSSSGRSLRIILPFLFLFISTSLYGQFLDSIHSSFKYKPRPDLRMNMRTSFITAQPARISGIKVGLAWNNTVRAGLGYNWLISDITKPHPVLDKTDMKLHFHYLTPYFEYTYYKKEKWQLSIPVLLGVGQTWYSYTDELGRTRSGSSNGTLLYEPYMTGEYKIIRYFGIGFGVGYRLILIGSRKTDQNLTSPIYVFNFKLYFDQMYKDLKKRWGRND